MAVISFSEALAAVNEYAARLSPTEPELVSLLDAPGSGASRGSGCRSRLPSVCPGHARWLRRSLEDVAKVPARLRCIGELKAGGECRRRARSRLQPGEAVEIMTGAPVPSGADAVVDGRVHRTKAARSYRTSGRSSRARTWSPRDRRRARGDVMVSRGTRVNHVAVAIAAAVGKS